MLQHLSFPQISKTHASSQSITLLCCQEMKRNASFARGESSQECLQVRLGQNRCSSRRGLPLGMKPSWGLHCPTTWAAKPTAEHLHKNSRATLQQQLLQPRNLPSILRTQWLTEVAVSGTLETSPMPSTSLLLLKTCQSIFRGTQ